MAKTTDPKNAPQKNPPEESVDHFAEEVIKRVTSIVGREQAGKVAAQVIALYQQERFSGPIAHPRHLREYDDILPGSADRIIKMAEESQKHSRELESRALEADVHDTRDGRRYGFFALTILILGALILGLAGKEILAGAFLGAGALGTVSAFIKGRTAGR